MAKRGKRRITYAGYCPVIDVHCTNTQSDRGQCFVRVAGQKFKTKNHEATNAAVQRIAGLQVANRCTPAYSSTGLGGRGLSPVQQLRKEYNARIKALKAEAKAARAAAKKPAVPRTPQDWEIEIQPATREALHPEQEGGSSAAKRKKAKKKGKGKGKR